MYSTPLTQYGAYLELEAPGLTAVYDETFLPSFLLARGGDPRKYREFLKINRIGSVFDLEAGEMVIVPQKKSVVDFSVHPEA